MLLQLFNLIVSVIAEFFRL